MCGMALPFRWAFPRTRSRGYASTQLSCHTQDADGEAEPPLSANGAALFQTGATPQERIIESTKGL
jgi:hypothetical protein